MAEPQQPDQRMTSKTPATKQKNPKRVAAGKAVAEKTRIAREAQKKAFIEAQSIICAGKTGRASIGCRASISCRASIGCRSSIDQKRSNYNAMAEHHQHCRFIGRGLL